MKPPTLTCLLVILAATGIYSSITMHVVQVTLEGLEPRMARYMGTQLVSEWTSGGVSRKITTTKGDCSPGPPCAGETDKDHADRHKAAADAAVTVFPVDT